MSVLPPELQIDDLTFADLMRIALEDVPGASGGRWTQHGAVDPGITLLEVLAYLYEQRLFTADQTTDDTTRAGLRLLGIEGPRSVRAAATVLSVAYAGMPAALPAGTVFALADDAVDRRFALETDLSVLPVHGAGAEGSLAGPGDVLELVLDRDGPLVTAGMLSLLVAPTHGDATVPAAWEPGAVDAPPAATLAWTAVGADGGTEPVRPSDGTGGLRRAGLVRLAWPAVWNRLGPDRPRLRAVVTSGRFTEPPRLAFVVANAVVARHLVPASADVTADLAAWGPRPGSRVRVPGTSGQLNDGAGAVELVLTVEPDETGPTTWRSVTDLTGVGPDDRVFLVDRERGELVFGDGRAGRVPRLAAGGRARATYRLGGGLAGNLGTRGRWVQEQGPHTAENPVAAMGGEDAETLERTRQRAADALTVTDRTVTREDARRLAEETPGVPVARANTWLGHHPAFPCATVPSALTVVVVPAADRAGPVATWTLAPEPDGGVLSAVRTRLERARLLGQEVFVTGPSYRAVRLVVRLSGAADPGVEGRVREALTRHLDPLLGGSERQGWPFSGALRPSALIGVSAAAAGAEITVAGLTVSVDDGAPTDCADLAFGPADLPWLAGVAFERTGAAPSGGGLA